ncbi:MAG: HepT-like ribonuclease domain-containing protein [bacterium]
MKDEIKKYFLDIKISIESINEYLGEKRNFFEYQNNKQLRRAVERELSIIGERVNRILILDIQ